jgi:hypothetical protein
MSTLSTTPLFESNGSPSYSSAAIFFRLAFREQVFSVQSNIGAGILAGRSANAITLGQNIIIVGLFTQLLFFGFFIVVAIVFHRRIIQQPTQQSKRLRRKFFEEWKTLLYALYLASALITVRSIFRIIEYLDGNDGYIQRKEVFLYIFDGTLMFLITVIFNVIHPGKVLAATEDGRTELSSWHGDDNMITDEGAKEVSMMP